ncbi:MAG: acyl-CoA dehydrogenase family protein [Chloroflexi bacterium]|nr:acyl-CoA dehydrogenase family protein [Chloroflexota bacterium]
MDFGFTPEEESFRQEVRQFLRAEWRGESLFQDTPEWFEAAQELEKKLARRGWLTMAWPQEYGGRGASQVAQTIFREEAVSANAPTGGQGPRMVGPCLIVHGTEEQRRAFLPPIARAEVFWCQGFSEPESGSDLASLQTRAVRDGDDYVINGVKVWTSQAQQSDWIHVLARTDPTASKHRGISYFLVDMKTPGISVKPITQMTGRSGFNMTFFDNVRVPRGNMMGPENRGWYVATTLLDFERSGVQYAAVGRKAVERLVAYARETRADGGSLWQDLRVRCALADLLVNVEVSRLLAYRVAWMQGQGLVPNKEASISKVFGSEMLQRVAGVGINLLGLRGQLTAEEGLAPFGGRIEDLYLQAVSATIAAGTSEVQRNIIAMRGLGLPRG